MYTDITVAPEFANEPIRPIADSIAVDVRKGSFWVICCIMTHVYLLTIPYHVPVATGWIQAAWTTNNIPKV